MTPFLFADESDRYLADVYFRLLSGEEVFPNNHLLARGHGRADERVGAGRLGAVGSKVVPFAPATFAAVA